MKSVRDFIKEEQENHAVLAFGRMNPPTTGHLKLTNKVKDIADKVGGSHHVVMSHSQDSKKNPLSPSDKLKHAKRFFPDTNLSVSDKDHPDFLKQAQKLHKQGVTHLHMVAGSDRTEEYQKTLQKYNGTHEGALFNFKKIKVHSAGQRDPDAEGVEGMSASKMREHAKNGNFDDFRKGVPSHVSYEHTHELYKDVRKNMGLKESYKKTRFITEGVNDRGIFKAVFLGGGPGSGKDYVLSKVLDGHGLVEINSDNALEYLMDKSNLDKKMPDNEEMQRNVIRGKAKSIAELKQRLAINGRNGLIINGTADDPEKIIKIKKMLEDQGYDTSMIMVNTADEVSLQRNIERGQRGGRTVPENIRKEKWDAVQAARSHLAELFGANYHEFDNSEDLRTADPEIVKQKTDELQGLWKHFNKFTGAKPENELAKHWIGSQKQQSDVTMQAPAQKDKVQGTSDTPSKKSGAYQQAMKMGLEYYGFGRYGKGGSVTFRDHGGRLVPVNKNLGMNEQFTNFINQLKGNDHVEETTRTGIWEERKSRTSDGEDYYRNSEGARDETFREDGRTQEEYTEQTQTETQHTSNFSEANSCSKESGKNKTKISFSEARKKLSGALNPDE